MPNKSDRRSPTSQSLSSLARTVGLLRSEIKVNHQELQGTLSHVQEEMRTGFDQLYRHIDGFVKLHETLDIEMRVLKEQMNRLEERVKKLEP